MINTSAASSTGCNETHSKMGHHASSIAAAAGTNEPLDTGMQSIMFTFVKFGSSGKYNWNMKEKKNHTAAAKFFFYCWISLLPYFLPNLDGVWFPPTSQLSSITQQLVTDEAEGFGCFLWSIKPAKRHWSCSCCATGEGTKRLTAPFRIRELTNDYNWLDFFRWPSAWKSNPFLPSKKHSPFGSLDSPQMAVASSGFTQEFCIEKCIALASVMKTHIANKQCS